MKWFMNGIEYDVLPCPVCGNEELLIDAGMLAGSITCRRVDCRARIMRDDFHAALKDWNGGIASVFDHGTRIYSTAIQHGEVKMVEPVKKRGLKVEKVLEIPVAALNALPPEAVAAANHVQAARKEIDDRVFPWLVVVIATLGFMFGLLAGYTIWALS